MPYTTCPPLACHGTWKRDLAVRRPGPEQGAYSNMDVNANGNRMFRRQNVGQSTQKKKAPCQSAFAYGNYLSPRGAWYGVERDVHAHLAFERLIAPLRLRFPLVPLLQRPSLVGHVAARKAAIAYEAVDVLR